MKLKSYFFVVMLLASLSLSCSRTINSEVKVVDKPKNQKISGLEYGKKNGFPEHWWLNGDEPAKSWEILPSQADAGEVILSKRNELGLLLSNFGDTPFVYRGKTYASMEGFWQATKFPEDQFDVRFDPRVKWSYTRAQVEKMTGFEAKDAGKEASANLKLLGIDWVSFEGKKMLYREPGESPFYQLIIAAMQAKLLQNPEVRQVLLKTKNLKLRPDHTQEPDSPKAWLYHEIWMEFRSQIQKGEL